MKNFHIIIYFVIEILQFLGLIRINFITFMNSGLNMLMDIVFMVY